jgi:ATP-dependent RNA helicase DDX19/DBP5
MSTVQEKPVVETPAEGEPSEEKPAEAEAPVEPQAESSLAAAQVDGSGPPGNGSSLAESDYKVEVKLADMQMDPNNPLFSAQSFDDLKLYVSVLLRLGYTNCL